MSFLALRHKKTNLMRILCCVVTVYSILVSSFGCIFFRPSVIFIAYAVKDCRGAGADPSCQWVRDEVHPGQVTGLIAGATVYHRSHRFIQCANLWTVGGNPHKHLENIQQNDCNDTQRGHTLTTLSLNVNGWSEAIELPVLSAVETIVHTEENWFSMMADWCGGAAGPLMSAFCHLSLLSLSLCLSPSA